MEDAPPPDVAWLAAAIGEDPAGVAAELELGEKRRDFVSRELAEAGYSGHSLIDLLMRLTGVDEVQAHALASAEKLRQRSSDEQPAPRDAQLARNEIEARESNEQIARRRRGDEPVPERIDLACECSDPSCSRALTMAFSEYEWLRHHPWRFAMLPGHEAPAVEDVVERHEQYVIVEKHAETHRQVEAADPRA